MMLVWCGFRLLRLVAGAGREADIARVTKLLAPNGVLLSAVHAIDADDQRALTWEFPSECLPEHTQRLARTEEGAMVLAQKSLYYNCISREQTGYKVHTTAQRSTTTDLATNGSYFCRGS